MEGTTLSLTLIWQVLLAREVLAYMVTHLGYQPDAHAFTALLASASSNKNAPTHSAAYACLLRQMANHQRDASSGGPPRSGAERTREDYGPLTGNSRRRCGAAECRGQ